MCIRVFFFPLCVWLMRFGCFSVNACLVVFKMLFVLKLCECAECGKQIKAPETHNICHVALLRMFSQWSASSLMID